MPPTRPGRPQRRARHLIAAALGFAVAAPLATSLPAVAADPPLGVAIGNCVIGVSALPASTLLDARIKTPSGAVRATISFTTDTNGDGFGSCTTTLIRGGDTVVVTNHATSAVLVKQTIPAFRSRIDRDADTVTILGPAGAKVTLDPVICSPGLIDCGGGFQLYQKTLSAKGKATIDTTSAVDLIGSSAVDLSWQSTKAFVTWRIPVPHLDVQVGLTKGTGLTGIGQKATVKLKRASTVIASGTGTGAAPFGAFGAKLKTPGGQTATIGFSDVLLAPAIAPNASVIVTDLDLSISPTAVEFRCLSGQPYGIEVLDGTRRRTSGGGITPGGGAISWPMSEGQFTGLKAIVRCGTAAGDSIRSSATIP